VGPWDVVFDELFKKMPAHDGWPFRPPEFLNRIRQQDAFS
jgi:hypothetical protein